MPVRSTMYSTKIVGTSCHYARFLQCIYQGHPDSPFTETEIILLVMLYASYYIHTTGYV